MIRPRTLRPALLHLALGGALLGATTLSYADEQPAFQKNSPIFYLALSLMMCKVPNCFPIRKPSLMPSPKAIR